MNQKSLTSYLPHASGAVRVCCITPLVHVVEPVYHTARVLSTPAVMNLRVLSILPPVPRLFGEGQPCQPLQHLVYTTLIGLVKTIVIESVKCFLPALSKLLGNDVVTSIDWGIRSVSLNDTAFGKLSHF